jgi:hypothetical protein
MVFRPLYIAYDFPKLNVDIPRLDSSAINKQGVPRKIKPNELIRNKLYLLSISVIRSSINPVQRNLHEPNIRTSNGIC